MLKEYIQRRKLRLEMKAEFEEWGFHVQTRWEGFWYWLKQKWDRFGSI